MIMTFVSGTLKIAIPPIKKPRRKVYRYHKGDYESMRAETLKLQRKDTSTVTQILGRSRKISISLHRLFRNRQIKHIPSKTSRSVSSVPLDNT